MNLITPDNPNLIHHADIETGKIVSTFTFQKVGCGMAVLAGFFKLLGGQVLHEGQCPQSARRGGCHRAALIYQIAHKCLSHFRCACCALPIRRLRFAHPSLPVTRTRPQEGVDVPIRDIAHETKAAQLEERSTFLGLDNNRLARWDLRDPRGKVQVGVAAVHLVWSGWV